MLRSVVLLKGNAMLKLMRQKTMLLEAPFKEDENVWFINVNNPELFLMAKVMSNCIGAKTLTIKVQNKGLEVLTYDEAARVLVTASRYREYMEKMGKKPSVGINPEMFATPRNTSDGDEICFSISSRKYRGDSVSMTHPLLGTYSHFLFGVRYGYARNRDKVCVSTWSRLQNTRIAWSIRSVNAYLVQYLTEVPDEAKVILKETKKQLGLK